MFNSFGMSVRLSVPRISGNRDNLGLHGQVNSDTHPRGPLILKMGIFMIFHKNRHILINYWLEACLNVSI